MDGVLGRWWSIGGDHEIEARHGACRRVCSNLSVGAAKAGLIGNGTNTVDALFFLGASPQDPPSEIEDYEGPMVV